jgi:hypothetical protein
VHNPRQAMSRPDSVLSRLGNPLPKAVISVLAVKATEGPSLLGQLHPAKNTHRGIEVPRLKAHNT